MPDNRRNPVSGGTYIFTANLLNRASDLEVARIDVLREAVRTTRAQAPFHIDAWVVRQTTCMASGCCQRMMMMTPAAGPR